MSEIHDLDSIQMAPAHLEREWVITVDSPVAGVEQVMRALGNELPLLQGPYDNCVFTATGQSAFRKSVRGDICGTCE